MVAHRRRPPAGTAKAPTRPGAAGCAGPSSNGSQTVSGSKDLVEDRFRLVLVGVLCQSQLRDQDLARLGQHPLLAGGQPAVTLPAPQVAHDLRHLHHVAAVQLLEVRLVTARPVGRLLDVRCAQDVEDAVQTFLVDDVTDADQVEVARRNAYDEILLCHDAEDEVLLVLPLDRAHLDVFDDSGPVIGIHNRFAHGERHILQYHPSWVSILTRAATFSIWRLCRSDAVSGLDRSVADVPATRARRLGVSALARAGSGADGGY